MRFNIMIDNIRENESGSFLKDQIEKSHNQVVWLIHEIIIISH